MPAHFARSSTATKSCAPGRVERWGEVAGHSRVHSNAGWLVMEVAVVGKSCAVCSNINYEGKCTRMAASRADIGTVVNPAKTVALPPKGHAPTAEEISLLENVDVSITGEGGATVVGVPIGTDEYVLDRAMEVVRDGGADRLARCLANMPDKQAAALIAIDPLGQRTSCLERALDTSCLLYTSPSPRD